MSNGDSRIQITATCGEEITYRQWLAGMALQGLCANPDWMERMRKSYPEQWALIRENTAYYALEQADALLSAQEGQT